MNEFNPELYLLKIQKQKYKIAIFPILVVFIGFFLYSSFQFSFLKYVSLAGLLGYLLIIMLHKVNKAVPPVYESNCILSPISGKIKSIEGNSISIKKSIFDPIDVRCPSIKENFDLIWKYGKPKFFEEKCQHPGKLIGMIFGEAYCILKTLNNTKIKIEVGEKIIAGETILAEIIDNQE